MNEKRTHAMTRRKWKWTSKQIDELKSSRSSVLEFIGGGKH
jgi:hypothetical protein